MKTTMSMWKRAGMAAAGIAASLAFAAGAPAQADKPKKPDKEVQPDKDTRDVLILRTGTQVKGKIVKETEKSIEFMVMGAGGLSATRTYDRSEILDVQRGVAATEPAERGRIEPRIDPKKTVVVGEGQTKVYMLELTGEFGRDVSLTPIKEVVKDVRRTQPNVLVIKVDCDLVNRMGDKQPDFVPDSSAFNQLELVRQMEVLFTSQIDNDPTLKVKPRLVFWVKKALGGVAFFPFVGKEIYYTSDAKHGGIGILDLMFRGVGDHVVQEKQRSLRKGRAEGLAIQGGHPVEVLEAMARIDYVLSVSFVEGKPVFFEDTSGEILLTDDGKGPNEDSVDDIIRGKGNDVLTLDSEMAKKLGMSKGTADTESELMYALGYERNYTLTPGKSKDILSGWSTNVRNAEVQIRRLFREYSKVQVKAPGGWQQRADARSTQIKMLNDLLALIERYGEAINPYAIEANPEQMAQQARIQIDLIKQAQRLDKK